ncbi:MAG: T9SS type A sorting domain-containing protein [Luteibaculum sp.]
MKSLIKFCLLQFLVFVQILGFSQYFCTVEPNSVEYEKLKKTQVDFYRSYLDNLKDGKDTIGVVLHMLQDDDGSFGWEAEKIIALIEGTNELLEDAGLHLKFCREINLLRSSDYNTWNWDEEKEELFLEQHQRYGYLNLILVKQIPGGICAYASIPGADRDLIVMAQQCAKPYFLAHELGHFLGLLHTHMGSLCGLSADELVDGSNCETSGDLICDTPADPFLAVNGGLVGSNCEYFGDCKDGNGQLYNPMVNNMMAVHPYLGLCGPEFTPIQIARMQYALQTSRSNFLNNNCAALETSRFLVKRDDCQGVVDDGYEQGYFGNTVNQYTITHPNGVYGPIYLQFQEFDLGLGDSLFIYERKNLSGKLNLLATYTRGSNPDTISSGLYTYGVRMIFKTYENRPNGGWRASYACEKTSAIQELDRHDIIVFPNPSSNFIQVQLKPEMLRLKPHFKLYSVDGSICMQGPIDNGELDISSLDRGSYMLVVNVNGTQISKRITRI